MNKRMLRGPHLDDLSVTVGGPMLSNATHYRDVGVEMTQMVNEVRSPSFPLTAAQQGKDSLFGFCMFKLDDRRWFWHQRYHHLIVDGATMASITSRVASAYAEIDAGRPVPASHARGVAELVSSDRAYRMSADYLRDRSFWKEMLKDRPQVHSDGGAAWRCVERAA